MSQLFAGSNPNITNITKGSTTIQGLYKGSELLWPNIYNFAWNTYTSDVLIHSYVWVSDINLYIGYTLDDNILYSSSNGYNWTLWLTLPTKGYGTWNIYGIAYNQYSTDRKLLISAYDTRGYMVLSMNPSTKYFTNSTTAVVVGNRPILMGNNKFKYYSTIYPRYINNGDSEVTISSPTYDTTTYNYTQYGPMCNTVSESTLSWVIQQATKDVTPVVTTKLYWGASNVTIGNVPEGENYKYFTTSGGGSTLAYNTYNNTVYKYNGTTLQTATVTGLDGGALSTCKPRWVDKFKVYVSFGSVTYPGLYTSSDGIAWTKNDFSVTGSATYIDSYSNDTVHIYNQVNGIVTIGNLSI